MGGNLAKSPLAAIFYVALIWFAAALAPFSQGYLEASAEFTMPLLGFAYLAAYALWISIAMALLFSNTSVRGIGLLLPVILSVCGLQWGVPLFQQLMHGEITGAVSFLDTVFWAALGCVSTILLIVLLLFLYQRPQNTLEAKPDAKQPAGFHEPKFKLNIFGLVIRLLVLPVIFMVVYYLLWYFLLWRSEAVRLFFGAEENRGFMAEIIDILINRGFEVIVVLLKGLAYAVFSIPLLLLLKGKRTMYLIINAMQYLSCALLYLIPSPFLPGEVRMAYLVENAALLFVYGVVAGILMYTAFRKEGTPEAAPDAKPAAPAKGRADAPAVAGAKK